MEEPLPEIIDDDMIDLFGSLATLLSQLVKAGVMDQPTYRLYFKKIMQATSTNQYALLAQYRLELSTMAANVAKYTAASPLLGLIQYIVMDQTKLPSGPLYYTPEAFNLYHAMGGNIKELVARLRDQGASVTTETKLHFFAPKGANGQTLQNTLDEAYLDLLKTPIRMPETQNILFETPFTATSVVLAVPNYAEYWKAVPVYPYYPHFRVHAPNKRIFNVARDFVALHDDKERNYLINYAAEELTLINNEFYYGNGSPMGMVGRMKKCNAVYDMLKAKRHGEKVSDAAYDEVVKKLFVYRNDAKLVNYAAFQTEIEAPVFLLNATWLCGRAIETGTPIFNVAVGSDAGPMWDHLKKGDTFPADLMLADQLFADCANREIRYNDLTKKWALIFVAKAKPKSEVYAREEWDSKTRIIYAPNSFFGLALQLVTKLPLQSMHNYRTMPGNRNMMGFRVAHGEFDAFYRGLLKTSFACFVFADNLFVMDGLSTEPGFRSYDGEKHEACATENATQPFFRQCYNFWEDAVNLTHATGADIIQVNQQMYGLKRFFQMAGNVVVNTYAQLANEQIQVKGLTSGSQATMPINTVTMGNVAIALEKALDGRKGSVANRRIANELFTGKSIARKLYEMGVAHGVSLTLECTTTLADMKSLHLAPGGTVIKMDLLGSDAAYLSYKIGQTEIFGIYVPVLNKERLMKSMVFQKTKDVEDKIKSRVAKREGGEGLSEVNTVTDNVLKALILDLFKYEQLYLIGGWVYPELSALLQIYISSLWQSILSKADDISYVIDAVTSLRLFSGHEESDIYANVFDTMRVSGPPKLWDVFRLFCDAGKYKRSLENVILLAQSVDITVIMDIVPWDVLVENGLADLVGAVVSPELQKTVAIDIDRSAGFEVTVTMMAEAKQKQAQKAVAQWFDIADETREHDEAEDTRQKREQRKPILVKTPKETSRKAAKHDAESWHDVEVNEDAMDMVTHIIESFKPWVWHDTDRTVLSLANKVAGTFWNFSGFIQSMINSQTDIEISSDQCRKCVSTYFERKGEKAGVKVLTPDLPLPPKAIPVKRTGGRSGTAAMQLARATHGSEALLVWPSK